MQLAYGINRPAQESTSPMHFSRLKETKQRKSRRPHQDTFDQEKYKKNLSPLKQLGIEQNQGLRDWKLLL